MNESAAARAWQPIGPWRFLAFVAGAGALLAAAALPGNGCLAVLDGANLLFHEAGHLVLGVFGPTPALYGGTLGQLAFPLIFTAAFARRRDPVGCAACALWFFENWLSIGRYAGDARAQVLPLVGGGEHDWHAILTRWHALSSDRLIASAARAFAWIGMTGTIAAVAWRYFIGQRRGGERTGARILVPPSRTPAGE